MWKWTEICIEGYCLIYMEYNRHNHPYDYELLDGNGYKTKEVSNPDYDPTFEKPIPPEYCPKMIGYTCLEKDCPHFAFTECSDECKEDEDND